VGEVDGAFGAPFEGRADGYEGKRAALDDRGNRSAVATSIDAFWPTQVLHDEIVVKRRLIHVGRGARPVTQLAVVPVSGVAGQIRWDGEALGPFLRG
jgi:hypothetical protein